MAELAARQHGVVARRQLMQLGFDAGAIKYRTGLGRLHPLHRGVYAVGHAKLTVHGKWMAAVLACGPGAVLSHRSAAALWELITAPAKIDVIGSGNRRNGMQLHRTRSLPREDRAVHLGIPVTSVTRTILDLKGRYLKYAVEQADRQGLVDFGQLQRRATGELKRMLAKYTEPPDTRSPLEQRFFELCRTAGLPLPSMNATVGGFVVDAFWPDRRVVVELDSWKFHKSREQFERDRERDAVLQLAGHRVLRLTDRRLDQERETVLRELRLLCGGRDQ